MSIASNIRRWHGGQVVIAWIVLALVGAGMLVAWFGALSRFGHNNWPNEDRAACLRVISLIRPDPQMVASLVERMSGKGAFDPDEAAQQLGLIPADTPRFLAQGGHLYRPTRSTDTSAMLADLSRFATFKDSIDTLFQNTYLARRGLRLDRVCATAHYAAIDRQLTILNALTLAGLAVLPVLGLWMTWVWFGGRAKRIDQA